MNFLTMEYFVEVARQRSFTHAAERLHITQQTLSAHIAAVERELGCRLLVRTTPLQMFVRTVLGKFTVEIMIPVYVVLMIFFNTTGLGGTLLLGALLVAQILIMALSANNYLIHDLLAGTVVVDVASQMIFRDTQDLIDYKKKLSREQSNRQDY